MKAMDRFAKRLFRLYGWLKYYSLSDRLGRREQLNRDHLLHLQSQSSH